MTVHLLRKLEKSPHLGVVTWLVLLIFVPVFLTGSLASLSLFSLGVLAWGAVGLALVIPKLFRRHPVFLRVLLSLGTLFLLFRYLFFRCGSTLIYTSPLEFFFVLCLFFAELYGMAIQVMGMAVNVMPLHRPIESVDLNSPELPTVDVLIPTYNEPEQMVAITASACTLFDYPKDKVNIYILDDGGTLQKRNNPDPEKTKAAHIRHETLKALAEFLEVNYRTRDRNYSAKAGNINEALYGIQKNQRNPHSDLVLILDCDHVPTRDILRNTVGYFMRDPKLFLVQTPHFFINPDPVEKNLEIFNKMPGDNVMFYGKVLPGLDFWNSAFFCGSAAILRRSCLDEVGGIVGDTITEDAETALTLHSRGYNSVYVEKPMVCGLCPETFNDFIIQRNRWAQGMVQILILKNPLFYKGLSLKQRICYLNSSGFWFFSFSRFMFMISPFLFLYGNLQVYHATLVQCLVYPIPYMVLSMILTNFMYGEVRHPFFSELYETVMAFFNLPAIIGVLFNPRSPQFKVTPKDTSLESDTVSQLAWPFHILLVLFLFMYPVAIVRVISSPQFWNSILLCGIWGTFNLFMLMLCLGVVWERRQIRKKHRMPVQEKIRVQRQDAEEWFDVVTTDLSEEGLGFNIRADCGIGQGDMIRIEAKDQSNRLYIVSAEVVRSITKEGMLHLGCMYEYVDEESFLNITNYFYGDSDRWQRLWNMRMKRVSLGKGMYMVLKLGFRGTYQHFTGLNKLVIRWLYKKQKQVWSKTYKDLGERIG
jgi:cellulose synthase (UDP-forming)